MVQYVSKSTVIRAEFTVPELRLIQEAFDRWTQIEEDYSDNVSDLRWQLAILMNDSE